MELGNVATKVRNFPEQKVSAHNAGQIGWGLFAETDFAPGDCIYWLKLHDSPRSNTIRWQNSFDECAERSFTVVPGFALCCSDAHPFWYSNHSCQANSGFVDWGRVRDDRLPIVAYEPIRKGQEITLDYPLFTPGYDGGADGRPWQMSPCLCHQPGCQGTITDFEHLPLDLQTQAIASLNGVQGRVLAHLLPVHPTLLSILQNLLPDSYAVYVQVLSEQVALAAQLNRSV